MSLRRLARDLTNTGLQRERALFHEVVTGLGATLVQAENPASRPIAPARYGLVHSGRPAILTWAGDTEFVRTSSENRPQRRAAIANAEVITGVAADVTPATFVLDGQQPRAFAAFTAGAGLLDACRRSLWQLSLPRPGHPAESLTHFLSITPRTKVADVLPPGALATMPTVVVTRTRLSERSPEEVARDLARAIDRGGWMAWSLEHRSAVPHDLFP